MMKSPRRTSHASRWTLLAALVALGLGSVLAKLVAIRSLKVPPAAYLVALEEDTVVRLRWKTRKLVTSLTLPAQALVSIPAAKKVLIVYSDGRQETVSGPTRIQIPTPPASDLDFLASPLSSLPVKPPEGEATMDKGIHITSPFGVTRFLNPTISWTPAEGTLYDVAVVDPADEVAPPRIARSVRPPVKIGALESKQGPTLPADRIFAVLVRIAGDSTLGDTSRFLTSQNATVDELPSQPPALLAEAVSALSHKPSRTGDAWLALSRLPDLWQHSELALRLRLRVSTELGLTDEIKKVRKEIGI